MPDDDDRSRDGPGVSGPSSERAAAEPWSDLVIPDDIRALWRDVSAYRRELRRRERARRLHDLLARRGVIPAIVVTAAVLLATLVAAMLTLMGPRPGGRAPVAARLASHPAHAPGAVGGLLPHATLYAQDGTPLDTHNPALRPQVFALVPPHCDCGRLLNALAGQADGEQLRLAIVVPTTADDSAGTIIDSLDRGRPSVYFDPQATLATTVTASGVTAVVVDEDGTIYAIARDITDPAKTTLTAQLQSMLLADRH